MGQRREANQLLEQSLGLLEDLTQHHPRSPQFAFLFATSLIAASGAAGTVDDSERVRSRLERSVSILDNLSVRVPLRRPLCQTLPSPSRAAFGAREASG